MPTNQPSNAPDAVEPRDDATPAGVIADERDDMPPGGGGLGGESAAGAVRATTGNAPNAPIDTGVDAGAAGASREAKARAADAPELTPVSR